MKRLMRVKDFLLELFFPIECLGCGKEGEWVCQRCFKTIPLNLQEECPRCKGFSLNCETHWQCRWGFYLDGLIAASCYDHLLVKKLIANLKYNYTKFLALPLSQIIVERLRYQGFFLEEDWFLVPVPLHKKRFLERGFNQAELFCQNIERLTGLIYCQNILKRRRWTPPQVSLSETDRLINVRDIFYCQRGLVKNKKILLVDDMFTTGTTLNECAKVLKIRGAKEVWGLVAAKG